jgi:hypothetical protein
LAAGTGFRAGEPRSLTPESFELAGDPPTVTVKAACSKHRRDDLQPIRPDLAAALGPWIASKAAGMPVFGNLTTHTASLIRHDLEAAGLASRDAATGTDGSARTAHRGRIGTDRGGRWME